MSRKQDKAFEAQKRQADFIAEKAQKAREKRWEDAQIKAATMQSVLDYAVDQFTQHKDELEAEVITKTEELIKERQSEIEAFLMEEKDIYVKAETGLIIDPIIEG
jgi:hypothetical protein